MNNILTINNTNTIKITDLPAITASVNTGMNGFEVTSTSFPSLIAGSFSETMQEAFAQLVSDNVSNEASNETSEATELAGNSLPIADVFPELSAEGNRPLVNLNIDFSDLLSIENKLQSLNTGDELAVDTSQGLSLSSVEMSLVKGDNAKSELSLSSLSSSPSPSSSLASPLIRPAVQSSDESIKPVVAPSSRESLAQQLTQPVDQNLSQVVAQSMGRPVGGLVGEPLQQSLVQSAAKVEPETLTEDIVVRNNKGRNIVAPVEGLLQPQQVSLANAITTVIAKDSDKVDTHQVSTINGSSKGSIESAGDQLYNRVHDESFVLNDVLLKSNPGLENNLAQFHFKSSFAALSSQDSGVVNHGSDEFNMVERSLLPPTTTTTLSPDENAVLLSPLNVLSSSLRTLLEARSSSSTKVAQTNFLNTSSNASGVISDNSTANINTGLEMNSLQSNLLQSSDGLSLTSELTGLMTDKTQTIPNTFSQQQLFSATQSSQVAALIQTEATPITSHNDSVSVITNSALNTLSNINLSAVSQTEITEAFGRTAWSQGMGKQVLSMVNQNIGSAEIRLNPAHLGPIEILIDMSEDQVNVSLSSRHAIVREAMEQALPKLREMLDENGFNLADADISKHSFAEQRERNSENKKDASNTIDSNNHGQLISSEISESLMQRVSSPTGIVDYFV